MSDATSAHDPWHQFSQLHHHANPRILDHKAWATDEALDVILTRMQTGVVEADKDTRPRWLKNLVTNRAKKHRNRRTILLKDYAYETSLYDDTPPEKDAIITEEIASVRARTTDAEWRILWGLASGDDYETVAGWMGMSIGALKSKVSRCRTRLSCSA